MIQIRISGVPGSGKTTLCNEIEALLESLGMLVRVEGEHQFAMVSDDEHNNRIESMRGREVVIITEKTPANIVT